MNEKSKADTAQSSSQITFRVDFAEVIHYLVKFLCVRWQTKNQRSGVTPP